MGNPMQLNPVVKASQNTLKRKTCLLGIVPKNKISQVAKNVRVNDVSEHFGKGKYKIGGIAFVSFAPVLDVIYQIENYHRLNGRIPKSFQNHIVNNLDDWEDKDAVKKVRQGLSNKNTKI